MFDRRWAAVTFERVRQRVRNEFHASGKGAMYDLFCAHVDGSELSYSEIGTRLGISEAAVKSAAHRLRQRLREVLWEEVAHTVASPEDVSSELRRIVTLAAAEGV
jgi:RNA polymerase sigma-70 factor (ECF subfamily)